MRLRENITKRWGERLCTIKRKQNRERERECVRLRESRTERGGGGRERAIKSESAIKRDQKKERGEGARERVPVTEIAWSKLAHHLPRMFTFEFTYLSAPEICVVLIASL